jgi:hypothetical protein
MLYLSLRYNFTNIVLLDSIITIGSSVDLNMTVRDLRDIPRKWVDLKKSLKNSLDGVFRAYSADERAFGS